MDKWSHDGLCLDGWIQQAGPRMCLGKDSAYLQMKMTTLLLLQFFNFELVKGQNLNYSMMVILSIAGGMKAHITQKMN
jgi:cytochrome P450